MAGRVSLVLTPSRTCARVAPIPRYRNYAYVNFLSMAEAEFATDRMRSFEFQGTVLRSEMTEARRTSCCLTISVGLAPRPAPPVPHAPRCLAVPGIFAGCDARTVATKTTSTGPATLFSPPLRPHSKIVLGPGITPTTRNIFSNNEATVVVEGIAESVSETDIYDAFASVGQLFSVNLIRKGDGAVRGLFRLSFFYLVLQTPAGLGGARLTSALRGGVVRGHLSIHQTLPLSTTARSRPPLWQPR